MRLGLATLALHPRRVPAAASPPSPPPPTGASIVGIEATPTSGTHNALSIPRAQGAGHGLLVAVLARPQFGGAQAATATWQGTPLAPVVNTSDASSTANDPILFVLALADAAAGAGDLALACNTSHSDTLVVAVETAGADLASIVAAFEREGTTSGTTLSGSVAGEGLALAIGGISLGTTVDWSAGWTEELEAKSDGGTGTSTLTGGVASRRAEGSTPATVTFGAPDDGRVLGLLVLPDAP